MTDESVLLRVTLAAEQLAPARARAAKAGFACVEDWVQALVEVDLRRAELETQVASAIEQGDFQQLAADLRERLRVASKDRKSDKG